ncbi:IclR family transcriptional regulator [Mycolicibacterium llatzerense]|uniref:IclR family transcriptional regulator n=1 Tax=Mycolicibacterium llatzerense TaxID=280871 RepID=UPI0021B4DCD1|nr:helix-turn-helix domain-containing protein [Mycolicibacterium llatzerense]MCT7361748.1 IclR family transcriptional regulator [Mycolicibacterium llatzerense]MCT7369088.1 IclR family transcriptional regulator [Mycolicibacterium llatzerense]
MTPKVDGPDVVSQVPSPPTERVIAVMHLLAAEPDRSFSLADITRRLDISRATGHAILTTLAAHQWVLRDEESAGYSCGPAVATLGRPSNNRAFRPVLTELSESIGTLVMLARRDGAALQIVDTVGESLTAPRLGPGFRVPLVAPFGRDYVAWAAESAQQTWLGAGQPATQLRKRLAAVLQETRRRGYVIERLSPEYVRVYSALRALAVEGEADAITRRLAWSFADLTLVDYLPGELDDSSPHQIATIAAPVRDADGLVTMSVSAAPFSTLTAVQVEDIGAQVCDAARRIEQRGVGA